MWLLSKPSSLTPKSPLTLHAASLLLIQGGTARGQDVSLMPVRACVRTYTIVVYECGGEGMVGHMVNAGTWA